MTRSTTRVVLGLSVASALLLGGCTSGGRAEAPPAPASTSAVRSDIARLGDCLEDAGFDVTVDEREHAIGYVGAGGDMTRYDGVYKACRKQLGL